MAKVTLYEYDGETRHESGVSINWRELGTMMFCDSEGFDEALDDLDDEEACDIRAKVSASQARQKLYFSMLLSWHGPWRNEHGHKCYEAETDHRPLYRAEVEE